MSWFKVSRLGDPVSDELDPWHTNIDTTVAKLFGHINANTRSFIKFAQETLPKISVQTSIKVGSTGYWDKVDEITAPRYAQTTDSVGRAMLFIDSDVIMERYNGGDTLIYYNRDNNIWSHSVACTEDIQGWLEKLKSSK